MQCTSLSAGNCWCVDIETGALTTSHEVRDRNGRPACQLVTINSSVVIQPIVDSQTATKRRFELNYDELYGVITLQVH
jgi:hypothetical protein